jgi:hypothetical protein
MACPQLRGIVNGLKQALIKMKYSEERVSIITNPQDTDAI